MSLFERTLPFQFEPLSTAPSEVIVPDSDTDDDSYRHTAKRRRVEEIGRRYICGQTIDIFSARLKGPFDKDWVTPWGKRTTARTSGYQPTDRKEHPINGTEKARQRGVVKPETAQESKITSMFNVGKPRLKSSVQQRNDADGPQKKTARDWSGNDRADEIGPRGGTKQGPVRSESERAVLKAAARTLHQPSSVEDEFRFEDEEDVTEAEVKRQSGHGRRQVNGVKRLRHSKLKDACSKIMPPTAQATTINAQPRDAEEHAPWLRPTDSKTLELVERGQGESPTRLDEDVPQRAEALHVEEDMAVGVQEMDLREADKETRDSFRQAKALSHLAASQGSRGNSSHPSRAPSMTAFLPSPVEMSAEISGGRTAGLKDAWSFMDAGPGRTKRSEQFSMSQPARARGRAKPESDARDAQRPRSSPIKSPPDSLHTLQPSRRSFKSRFPSMPSVAHAAAASPPDQRATEVEPPVQIDVPRTQPSTPESPVRLPVPNADGSPGGDDADDGREHVTIISPTRAPPSRKALATLDLRTPSVKVGTRNGEGGGINTQTLFDAVSPGALHTIKKKYGGQRGQRRPSTAKLDEEHDIHQPSARSGSTGLRGPRMTRPQSSGPPAGVLKRPARGVQPTHTTTAGSPRGSAAAAPDRHEGEELNAVIDEMMGGVLDPWDVERELKKQASRRTTTTTAPTGAIRTR